MNRTKWEAYSKKYGSLLVFLALELLLFTSLNLANYASLFRYLAIVMAIALVPILMLRFKKDEWLNVALLLGLPLLVYGAFMAISPLYMILLNVVDNIVMVLALEAFLVMGLALGRSPDFQLDKGLATIVGGLGVLLAIGLVYTIWRYTLFHVVRFQGQVLYFDGEAYPISNEAKWLFGFTFKEVNIAYFGQFSAMLAPGLTGLLFLDFKRIGKFDYIWIGAGAVGLLSIALLPNVGVIKYLLPGLVIALMARFYPRRPKWQAALGYGLIAGAALFALAALVLVLQAFEVPFIVNLIENNAIFARLYGNSLVVGYAEVIQAAIAHPFGGLHSILIGFNFLESTGSSVFDTLYQGGIFAAIGYIALLGTGGFTLWRYWRKSTDVAHLKIVLITFVTSFAIYTLFDHQYAPLIRETDRIYKMPFFSDLSLLLVIFLIGYAYMSVGREMQQIKTEASIEASVIEQV